MARPHGGAAVGGIPLSDRGIAHRAILWATLVVAGCSDPGGDGDRPRASRSCDPFSPDDAPLVLATILGAGRHPDGTLYVLDDGDPAFRAFVSEGAHLQRKIVSGSGSEPDWIVATIDDPVSPFALKIERPGGVAKRMAVYRGVLASKDFVIGSPGSDVLELVDKSALAGFTLRNIEDNVFVEYDARTDDGHRIIVVRPKVDWAYTDFRIFYGTNDALVQRKNLSVTRGSTTTIVFDVDGREVSAFFPSPTLAPNAGPAKLTAADGAVQVLTVATDDREARGGGISFVCF